MNKESPLLHIAFGQSAGGSIKQALAELGRRERVICEPDDLGYGPINPHNAAMRADFFGEGLGYEDEGAFIDQIDAFWDEVTSTTAIPVAWLSRRCVREYAGFLELVSRRDKPPLVVDVAAINFVDREGVAVRDISISMGFVSPRMMIDHDLFARATPMSDVEFRRERARWKKLKDENADLRVLDSTGLVSAPITFFDKLITSYVTKQWQPCPKVIANVLVGSAKEFRQTDDLFLWSRLRTLVEDGLLEGKGDMLLMRNSSVRKHRASS